MILKYQIKEILEKIIKKHFTQSIPLILSDKNALCFILKILLIECHERIIIWKSFIINEIDRFSKINIGMIILSIVLFIIFLIILFQCNFHEEFINKSSNEFLSGTI